MQAAVTKFWGWLNVTRGGMLFELLLIKNTQQQKLFLKADVFEITN
ncbi:MAG: hypothetical protein ACJA2E_000049 [Arenicella sp.]|jgi:hypothetical protein